MDLGSASEAAARGPNVTTAERASPSRTLAPLHEAGCTLQPVASGAAVSPSDDRPAGYLARLALVLPLVVLAPEAFVAVLALVIFALAVFFDLGRPRPMRLAISERCSA